MKFFFYPLNVSERGSQPSLTTRGRELVSVLEVRIEHGDLNQRPLTPQSVTLPTLRRNFFPLSVSLWNDLDVMTLYSMVWDWQVSRAGPMFFIDLNCSLPFCLLLFSFSLLSFYRLVL